jgi:hypothetical protein
MMYLATVPTFFGLDPPELHHVPLSPVLYSGNIDITHSRFRPLCWCVLPSFCLDWLGSADVFRSSLYLQPRNLTPIFTPVLTPDKPIGSLKLGYVMTVVVCQPLTANTHCKPGEEHFIYYIDGTATSVFNQQTPRQKCLLCVCVCVRACVMENPKQITLRDPFCSRYKIQSLQRGTKNRTAGIFLEVEQLIYGFGYNETVQPAYKIVLRVDI